MARRELPTDHLSDYERAICYYSLPSVLSPVTQGLVVVYACIILEAVGVMLIGFVTGRNDWTIWGAVAFNVVVVFGLVVFTARALLAEIRHRKMVAAARGVPDAAVDEDDLPDPFETHLLIQRPLSVEGKVFWCADTEGTVLYLVESEAHGRAWTVKTPESEEVCTVRARTRNRSFLLRIGPPHHLTVSAKGEEVAQIHTCFSFTAPWIRITCSQPGLRTYAIRQEGIYIDNKLVGRIYALRKTLYLDIDKAYFSEGILAHFVTKS